MVWLEGLPEGDTDWDRLASLHPDAFGALADLVAAAWEDTDPVLLELARLRIATLLGNDAELARRSGRAARPASLKPRWRSWPRGQRHRFSPTATGPVSQSPSSSSWTPTG